MVAVSGSGSAFGRSVGALALLACAGLAATQEVALLGGGGRDRLRGWGSPRGVAHPAAVLALSALSVSLALPAALAARKTTGSESLFEDDVVGVTKPSKNAQTTLPKEKKKKGSKKGKKRGGRKGKKRVKPRQREDGDWERSDGTLFPEGHKVPMPDDFNPDEVDISTMDMGAVPLVADPLGGSSKKKKGKGKSKSEPRRKFKGATSDPQDEMDEHADRFAGTQDDLEEKMKEFKGIHLEELSELKDKLDSVDVKDVTTMHQVQKLLRDPKYRRALKTLTKFGNDEQVKNLQMLMDDVPAEGPGVFDPTDDCVACLSTMELFAHTWVGLLEEFQLRQLSGKDADGFKAESGNRVRITPELLQERTEGMCGNERAEGMKDFVRDFCDDVMADGRRRNYVTREFLGKFNDEIELAVAKKKVCVTKLKMCRKKDVPQFIGDDQCSQCMALMKDAAYLARRIHDPDSSYMPSEPVMDALCDRLDFRHPDLTENYIKMNRFCEKMKDEYEDEIMSVLDSEFKRDEEREQIFRVPFADVAKRICVEETSMCTDEGEDPDLEFEL